GRRTYAAERGQAPRLARDARRASMGPPHVRGGEVDPSDESDYRRACFNGAAARTRRRANNRASLCWGDAGFNGAAARTRRRDGPRAAGRRDLLASMGPPHVRGGESPDTPW